MKANKVMSYIINFIDIIKLIGLQQKVKSVLYQKVWQDSHCLVEHHNIINMFLKNYVPWRKGSPESQWFTVIYFPGLIW